VYVEILGNPLLAAYHKHVSSVSTGYNAVHGAINGVPCSATGMYHVLICNEPSALRCRFIHPTRTVVTTFLAVLAVLPLLS
jgi:hypothetical protein